MFDTALHTFNLVKMLLLTQVHAEECLCVAHYAVDQTQEEGQLCPDLHVTPPGEEKKSHEKDASMLLINTQITLNKQHSNKRVQSK